MNHQIIIAGFGGQGILFAGKFLAYGGLIDGHELSWLPSYGPEMRGGTANCNVILSDEPVGSPIITDPTVLIAMNTPSYDKFIDDVVPGGLVLVDSTLVHVSKKRDDVKLISIPATGLASDNGLTGLANIIITGRFIKEVGLFGESTLEASMKKCVPAKKAEMLGLNLKALSIGMEYAD